MLTSLDVYHVKHEEAKLAPKPKPAMLLTESQIQKSEPEVSRMTAHHTTKVKINGLTIHIYNYLPGTSVPQFLARAT